MLVPKRVKHRREFRGKMRGEAKGGKEIAYGEFGLQALDSAWITNRQIEASRIDRKSTRLNSSHVSNSYAVFCLNYTSTHYTYTLSLHDALPIYKKYSRGGLKHVST